MNVLEGFIKVILYQNKENGYVIAKVKVKKADFDWDQDDLLTITGYFPVLHSSEFYQFEGGVMTHPKYGVQFKVEKFSSLVSNDLDGLIAYFSSDLFFGVGPKLAEKIVNAFGEQAIETILKDKTVLKELGINDRKITEIYTALEVNQGLSSVLTKLYGFGFGTKLSMQIYHKYGNLSVELIEENPYRLIGDFDSVSFQKADKIAEALGFEELNPKRLHAMLKHLVDQLTMNGDTAHEYDDVLTFMQKEVPELSEDEFLSLLEHHSEIHFDDTIMLQDLYDAESIIAEELKRFRCPKDARVDFEVILDQISKTHQMQYALMQKQAILTAMEEPISIITGGPGTGKTTVLLGLIEVYKQAYQMYDNRKIALVSPTGRAAKRMSESTNYEAKTIHSFLGYDFRGEFNYNKDHKIGPKLLIIDESSMIDTYLMKQLLESLKSDVRIVIIGDVDQLPSVGPGQVLEDFIDSKKIPTTKLTDIFRQQEDSKLISLAYGINNGQLEEEWFGTDVRFLECSTPLISKTVQQVVKQALEKEVPLEDIQVLAPMYKGSAGIDQLNYDLQDVLNPTRTGMEHYSRTFKVNDRVLQLVNQPDKGIMNGDIGTVVSTKEKVTVSFDSGFVEYTKADLFHLKHAYCISIHKSQGNEYPTVIVPITRQYSIMLTRKLYYTAVTRAKQHVIFVGELEALHAAVTKELRPRRTHLKERLG